MRREIIDFVLDDSDDWIARLSCGHSQHVRHRPPFQERAWVLDEVTRRARLGTCLLCPLCDRAELPEGLHFVRKSPVWDNATAPSAIKDSHRLDEGTWGVITVGVGRVRFATHGDVVMNVLIAAGSRQAVPPGLDHSVAFTGPVRFSIDYFSVDRGEFDGVPTFDPPEVSRDEELDFGGESACFANLVCTVCGAVLEGDYHEHGFDPQLDQ